MCFWLHPSPRYAVELRDFLADSQEQVTVSYRQDTETKLQLGPVAYASKGIGLEHSQCTDRMSFSPFGLAAFACSLITSARQKGTTDV